MKRLPEIKTLPLIALLALGPVVTAPASGEKKLPDFRLNSVRISGIPRLPDAAIPPVPPPTDTGYYPRVKAGDLRLDSSVTVTVDGGKGKAEINFPRMKHPGARSGFRSSLFVKFAPHNSAAVLSWAAVLCSGPQYLGYKGSSLKFPDRAGDFTIKDEALSLGPLKAQLGRTHPWVIPAGEDGFRDLDRLCSADFPSRMKAFNIKALPREAGGYIFRYDPAADLLTVSWPK